jgi:trans-aconitate 2-methyltransferase
MLARAQAHARPRLRFERRPIEELDGEWDLIFSNAALQWVDDHAALVPRLIAHLSPGGQLVVQMPSNHQHVSHHIIRAVAAEAPFAAALAGFDRRSPVGDIAFYAELLYAAGGRELEVFEKVYPHVLADADAVTDWVRSTAMLPYVERLPAELGAQLVERVRAAMRKRWPEGPVFYPFRRTLFAAARA